MPTAARPFSAFFQGAQLVGRSVGTATLRALWWLNAACLLEAAVGVSWQISFARVIGWKLPPSRCVLLFAGIWLAYVADRWLDASPIRRAGASYRHAFIQRRRRSILGLWSLVLAGSVALAVRSLTPNEWRRCAALLLGTLVYTSLVHWLPKRRVFNSSGAKEATVAALFAISLTLFTRTHTQVFPRVLLAPSLAFFGLALLNLLTIAHHERALDRALGFDSAAQRPQAVLTLSLLVAGMFTAGTLLAALSGTLTVNPWLPIGLSCIALFWLLRFGASLGTDTSHALADLALLTPLFTWLM